MQDKEQPSLLTLDITRARRRFPAGEPPEKDKAGARRLGVSTATRRQPPLGKGLRPWAPPPPPPPPPARPQDRRS